MSTINYVTLSSLAYISFIKEARGATIGDILEEDLYRGKMDINSFELSPLTNPSNPLRSYTLLNFTQNSPSGFSAAAFKSPSGEIVFSFQGTDLSKNWGVDGAVDFGIFMRESYSTISKHLDDAKSFVYSVLNNPDNKGANYSFTGHSLGGAIAQYMTYVTNTDNIAGVGKAITFNAPGIGEVIEDKHNTNISPRDYDHLITDYVNESDVIGDWRTEHQLGRTVYVRSKLSLCSLTDYCMKLTLKIKYNYKQQVRGTI